MDEIAACEVTWLSGNPLAQVTPYCLVSAVREVPYKVLSPTDSVHMHVHGQAFRDVVKGALRLLRGGPEVHCHRPERMYNTVYAVVLF